MDAMDFPQRSFEIQFPDHLFLYYVGTTLVWMVSLPKLEMPLSHCDVYSIVCYMI